MKLKHLILFLMLMCGSALTGWSQQKVYNVADYGLKADGKKNASPVVQKIMKAILAENETGAQELILRFPKGVYRFYEKGAAVRTYYISNHEQTPTKTVGMAIEGLNNLTVDGEGSQFIFEGRMLPIALVNSENCTLKNLSIDFEHPHIAQLTVKENSPEKGITFEVAPWVDYRITRDSVFEHRGKGWTMRPFVGMAFEGDTRHIVYRTSDIDCPLRGLIRGKGRMIQAPGWKDERLVPGTVVAARTYGRPAPGIFLSHDVNTRLENIKVHYAEGMGLLAQVCEDITLQNFSVCLKGENDPRYFTTQADATHFSGCKGSIVSKGGLYEGMMDDAINVHGTYLKVVDRIDDYTLVGRYMHGQSWGFDWGYEGDEVQFVRSETMDVLPVTNRIVGIEPHGQTDVQGAHEFLVRFEQPLDGSISNAEGWGMENLTWTPSVVFSDNVVRNNRARGSLFSTPKPVLVENNLFDHISGSAILLCGDCNGWYETGACKDVLIRKNKFVNSLTSLFQFTSAVISIYPEIPNLKGQTTFFHQGIVIEDNEFDLFDYPVLYAKSVDGLVFKNNMIRMNRDYKPYHWNNKRVVLERVNKAEIDF